jgi:hypothetical protein
MRNRMRWFNISAPVIRIRGNHIRLWNLFNRHTSDGDHWWGIGILQVNRRHLVFVGFCGVYFFFVGETP